MKRIILNESQLKMLFEISTSDIEAEIKNVNLSPTDLQKEAGNYRMGHIYVKGMGISIENPIGSVRKFKDCNGKEGKIVMKNHYGYFRNTRGNGKDDDAVDVFLGPHIEDFERVYVIDQNNKNGEFDESKVMLGFLSKEEAKKAYLSNYDPSWKGFRTITGVSLKHFKKWLYRGNKQRKPFSEYVAIQKQKLEESKKYKIVKESHISKLYHFLSFDAFKNIVITNTFTPSNIEKDWVNGKNSMSFSRTKTFREGWPIIMYSGEDGKGDSWCAIRLTIDGDLINMKPNFKIGNKQYNMSLKPFDWAYKQHNNGDSFDFADNYGGIFAKNGKEWMMQSNDYTTSYLPIQWDNGNYFSGVGDRQGHPYSQAEERLTTNAEKIPNASDYIVKVDILLMVYNFDEYNEDERKELYNILIKNKKFRNKISVYTSMNDLEHEFGELSKKEYSILIENEDERKYFDDPIPLQIIKKQDF